MMYARAYHFEVDVEQKTKVPSRRLHLVIKVLGAFFAVDRLGGSERSRPSMITPYTTC